MIAAHASGAKESSDACCATWATATPCALRSTLEPMSRPCTASPNDRAAVRVCSDGSIALPSACSTRTRTTSSVLRYRTLSHSDLAHHLHHCRRGRWPAAQQLRAPALPGRDDEPLEL